MAYLTETDVADSLGATLTTAEQAQADALILAAEAAANTRTFRP